MLHFAPDNCPLYRISHSQNEPQVIPVHIIEVQEQPVRGRGNRMAQIVLTVYCCTIIVFIVISAARIIPEL